MDLLMLELVYTSVPKGLLPGSKGFATVAMTTGMPPQIAQTCEALSSYCHVFGLESDKYKNNPVAISYLRVRLGGRVLYAISRTGAAAADYSSRTNKISHHVLLDTNTGDPLPEPGPAALFEALSFRDQWTGEPTYLPERKAPALPNLPRTPPSFHARNWQKAGLSTTLAARLAAAWLANPTRPTFLTFKPDGQPNDYLLGLIDDVIRLLPPESRWNATFSTYLSNELPGTECIGRCVLQNSQGLALAQRVPDTLIIDTTTGQMSGGEYAAATAKELEPAADGLALPPWADPTRKHKEIPQEQSQTGPTGTLEREPLRLRDRSSSEQTIEPPVEPNDTIAQKTPRNRLWVAGIATIAAIFIVIATFLCLRQVPAKKEEPLAPTRGIDTPSETIRQPTNQLLSQNIATTNAHQQTISIPTNTEGLTTTQNPPSQTNASTTLQPATPTTTNPTPQVKEPTARQLKTDAKPITLCEEHNLQTTKDEVQRVTLDNGDLFKPTWKPQTGAWEGISKNTVLQKYDMREPKDMATLATVTLGVPTRWANTRTMLLETPTNRLLIIAAETPFKCKGARSAKSTGTLQTITFGTEPGTPALIPIIDWVATNAIIKVTPTSVTVAGAPKRTIGNTGTPTWQIDVQCAESATEKTTIIPPGTIDECNALKKELTDATMKPKNARTPGGTLLTYLQRFIGLNKRLPTPTQLDEHNGKECEERVNQYNSEVAANKEHNPGAANESLVKDFYEQPTFGGSKHDSLGHKLQTWTAQLLEKFQQQIGAKDKPIKQSKPSLEFDIGNTSVMVIEFADTL